MKSRVVMIVVFVIMLLASLATPLAVAQKPEDLELAGPAQEAEAAIAEPRAESAPAIVDETLARPAPAGSLSSPRLPLPQGEGHAVAAGAIALLDDFNRADGPIGPNWTVHDGFCNVFSNAAVCGNMGRATFIGAPGDGNRAEADIATVGIDLQYTGLLLNYGAGATNLFLKVQQQGGSGTFDYAACYTGNNGGGFGLGFFPLDSPFSTAHMRVTRVGDDVTLQFTNIDGGAQPPQVYVCSGAPAPEGTGIGILGYVGVARLDNFGISYYVHLPAVLRHYPFDPYFEPNDHWLDAYGPLASGQAYQAYPDDPEDYYTFTLPGARTVDVVVSNYAPTSDNGQLLVYGPAVGNERGPLVGQFGLPGQTEMRIDDLALGAGKYYVRIFTSGAYSNSQLYTLRVTY